MTEYLVLADLLVIARDAIGAEPLVRDLGLLESAAARPRTSVLGQDAYPDLHTKAAALLHSLACNHPLVDGNRRLAWLATYVFLDLNGAPPDADQDEVVAFVLSVAGGTLSEVEAIAKRLAAGT